MHRLIFVPTAVLIAWIGAMNPGLALGLTVSTVCNGNLRFDGDQVGNPVYGENYGPAPAQCDVNVNDATPAGAAVGYVSSHGEANAAVLRAYAYTQSTVSLVDRPQLTYAESRTRGYAEVGVDDSFVVRSNQVSPGSLLSITLGIYVDGTVSGAGSNQFNAISSTLYSSTLVQGNRVLAGTSGEQFTRNGTLEIVGTPGNGGSTSDGHTFNGLHEMTLTLAEGSSVDLYLRASAYSNTLALAGGEVLSSSAVSWGDMGSTLTWAGISAVRTADGTLLSGYSAISGTSGFDYVNPYAVVPESSSIVMLLTGLGLLQWHRRGSRAARVR